jgi:hypothetical protein
LDKQILNTNHQNANALKVKNHFKLQKQFLTAAKETSMSKSRKKKIEPQPNCGKLGLKQQA